MTVPATAGVYGGGRMGAGIAHAFAVAGSAVTVVETGAAADAARARVRKSLAKAAGKGVEVPGTVTVVTDPALLAGVPLVVETVPELVGLKHSVLATIARSAPGAVIGTSTSSLSIDVLAGALPDPSVLIGLHFFDPVPASDLVEVVVGERTSPELVARAREWVRGLGKHAITVRNSPGFASSRLGVAIALEAMRVVQEGVASAEDIDSAMVLGYRHPMGPLRTTDIVGLDVRLAIAEHLERELGPRFAPPRLPRDEVAAGQLGRKTGEGFYQW
jgi:3-hydroxybutyryl-CoA dehydrogenase